MEALDRGAMYPILTDGDANLTEGSGFNVILIKDGKLHTPKNSATPIRSTMFPLSLPTSATKSSS